MRHVVLGVFLLAWGCTPPEPIQGTPLQRPDAPPYVPPVDGGVDLDMAQPQPDSAVVVTPDQGPDVFAGDVIDTDAAAPPDGAADVPLPPDFGAPEDRPTPARARVISARRAAYLVWVQGGRLFSARRERNADGFEAVRDITEAPPVLRLVGGGTRSGHAWIVLPDGAGGELRAYDISLPDPVPQALGLFEPAVAIETGARVVVYGRTASGRDGVLGWRSLSEGEPGEAFSTKRGTPGPSHAVSGLGQRVLGFDDGTCRSFADDLEGGSWPCGVRPDDVLVGSSDDLIRIGTINAGFAAAPIAPGVTEPEIRELADAQIRHRLGTFGGGAVLTVDEGDQAHLWLVRSGRADAIEIEDGDGVYGLADLGGDPLLIDWPADASGPRASPVALQARNAPPVYQKPPACLTLVQPEDCGEADRDCSGAPNDALCCNDAESPDTELELDTQQVPNGAFFVGYSAAGLLFGLVLEIEGGLREARLLTQSVGAEGPPLDEKARWPGVRAIHRFANFQVRTAMLATVDPDPENPEGEPRTQILIYAGRALGDVEPQYAVPSPCAVNEVRHLHMTGEGTRVRLYCVDQYYEIDPIADTTQANPYPAQADVRWITRFTQFGDELLLGSGEAYSLTRLRVVEDGIEAIPALPDVLLDMGRGDRELPIQMSPEGVPARVREGRLEKYIPQAGWRVAPNTSWPISVYISADDPFAISSAYTGSPEDQLEPPTVQFYAHDLRAGASAWGKELPINRTTLPATHQGHTVSLYGSRFGPAWFRALGSQDITLHGFEMTCR